MAGDATTARVHQIVITARPCAGKTTAESKLPPPISDTESEDSTTSSDDEATSLFSEDASLFASHDMASESESIATEESAAGRRSRLAALVIAVAVVASGLQHAGLRAPPSWLRLPARSGARRAARKPLSSLALSASSLRQARTRGGSVAPSPFLRAVDELMPVYEALGPVIRSAAAKDLRGNAVKLRRNGAERAIALHALVGADLAAGNHTDPDSSAMALLWLKRILEFTVTIFEELLELRPPREGEGRRRRDRELADCVTVGYWKHLGPHHNQIFRYMAASVLAIVPPVAEFAEALGHRSLTQLRPDMRRWVDAAKPPLRDLDAYFRSVRLER